MAKIIGQPIVTLEVAFVVNEAEARALDALTGYGDDAFIRVFYKELGQAYMKPHEAGLRSFLKSIREQLSNPLWRADEARKVFRGTHDAIHKQQRKITSLKKTGSD